MDQVKRYTLIFAFIILGVIVFTPIGFVIWYLRDIVLFIVLAAVISLMGRPVIKLLEKVKFRNFSLPESVNAIITLLVIYAMASLIFVIFIPSLLKQTQKLENVNVEAVSRGLKEPIEGIQQLLKTYNLSEDELLVEDYFAGRVKEVLASTSIPGIANAVVGFTGDLVISLFAVSFIAFFFLKERSLPHQMVILATPPRYHQKVDIILSSIKRLLTRYFLGVVAEILLVGGLISVGLSILGVENAMLIGFFAGLFNVIPYLGPILGAILGASLTILGGLYMDFYTEMLPLILKVLVVFTIVQLIDNFVFQPFIYSSSVKAHPLEIFLVILIAGNLAGVGGMILAIPIYTILRVIAKEFFDQFEIVRTITKGI